MRSIAQAALAAAALVTGLGGCGDFLTGPKLQDDPNNPTQTTNASLFIAVQTNVGFLQEANLARTVCVFMDQCSAQGTFANYGTYQVITDGDAWYNDWAKFYGGGGLIDLRTLQASALSPSVGDSLYAGIAAVMEAWLMGVAADIWGDVPYDEAADPAVFPQPAQDTQAEVYAHVQAKLDSAIGFMAAAGPTNIGPVGNDAVYGGDPAPWTALAHTLKARFYLHTAEQVGTTAYQAALAEALQGVAAGGDYLTQHTSDVTASNIWFQFTSTQAPDYIAAGKFLVDQLVNTADPRLEAYYAPLANGSFVGAAPGQQLSASGVSTFAPTRVAADFQQPLVTAAENDLIVAEASFQTGDQGTALTRLESARASAGLAPLSPAPSGPALLEAILTEKYIQLFQNIEVWNDYKRTCLPLLSPYVGSTGIPSRLPIPATERAVNASVTDPGPTARNGNDPIPCP